MYPCEEIPNSNKLYCRVHKANVREGELLPIVFKERGEGDEKGLSVDWERYSTPDDTRKRAKNPELNGVVNFVAGKIRELPMNLTVNHAPLYYSELATKTLIDNQSHSNINGTDSVKSRLIGLDIYEWEIKI